MDSKVNIVTLSQFPGKCKERYLFSPILELVLLFQELLAERTPPYHKLTDSSSGSEHKTYVHAGNSARLW